MEGKTCWSVCAQAHCFFKCAQQEQEQTKERNNRTKTKKMTSVLFDQCWLGWLHWRNKTPFLRLVYSIFYWPFYRQNRIVFQQDPCHRTHFLHVISLFSPHDCTGEITRTIWCWNLAEFNVFMEHKDFVFNNLEQNAALVWIHWVNEHESFGRRRMVHLQVLCVTGSEQQFAIYEKCFL